MKWKMIAVALIASLITSSLVGCGSSQNVTSSSQSKAISDEQDSSVTQAVDASTSEADSSASTYTEGSGGSAEAMEKLLTEFGGSEKTGKNSVCSPLNIYLALAMLSDCADGESQKQLLNLLGADSMDDLKTQAEKYYTIYTYAKNTDDYSEDAESSAPSDEDFTNYEMVSKLSNSLWIGDSYPVNEDALEKVSSDFHASLNQGTFGSEEFDKKFQTWLNNSTGDLLKDQAGGMKFDPETILALASAIYYKTPWIDNFEESDTKDEIFHAPGKDVTVPTMYQSDTMLYYEGNSFKAVGLSLADNNDFYILLPDEGTDPSSLFKDRQALDLLEKGWDMDGITSPKVNLYLPKIDVTSDRSLIDGLKELGVKDVFTPDKADFSPLFNEESAYVNSVHHAARLSADEKGIVAAAFTVIMMEGAAYQEEEPIEFKVDRPFAFAVSGMDGAILFAGTVYNPAESS